MFQRSLVRIFLFYSRKVPNLYAIYILLCLNIIKVFVGLILAVLLATSNASGDFIFDDDSTDDSTTDIPPKKLKCYGKYIIILYHYSH